VVWLAALSAVLHCRAAVDSCGQLAGLFVRSCPLHVLHFVRNHMKCNNFTIVLRFLAALLSRSTNIGRPVDPVRMLGPSCLLVLHLCKASPFTGKWVTDLLNVFRVLRSVGLCMANRWSPPGRP
jgi:hypothetical protein